jgi:TonB family protein
MVLNRRGNVLSVVIAKSSGDAAYDEAAVSMIRRSDPVPVPPANLIDEQFLLEMDILFPAVKVAEQAAPKSKRSAKGN